VSLGEFLKEAASDRAPWNCSTLPADWCLALGHPDFAAEWREITDDAECEKITAESGGLIVLWERGIGDALPAVSPTTADALKAGDIAVIAICGNEAGAIWTDQRWAIKAARGLHFLPPENLHIAKVWRP